MRGTRYAEDDEAVPVIEHAAQEPGRRPYHLVLLLVILLGSFLLRFAVVDYPLGAQGGDGIRDYVVAQHALAYNEWPINGPPIGFIDGVRNSPAYYYLIIAIVAVNASFGFLAFGFALLQCALVAGTFFLGRALFGPVAGLYAALLVGILPTLIQTSAGFIWQPSVMEPFVVCSFYALVMSLKRSDPRLLVLSIALVLLACAIHLSVLGVLPLYAILCGYVGWRVLCGWTEYLGTALITLSIALVLFLPPLTHPTNDHLTLTRTSAPSVGQALAPIPASVMPVVSTYLSTYGLRLPLPNSGRLGEILFIALTMGIAWYLAAATISKREKLYVLMLLAFILQQIIVVALIDPQGVVRNLDPVIWALPIAIAALIDAAFRQRSYFIAASALVAVLLLYNLASDPRVVHAAESIGNLSRPNEVTIDAAASAIASTARGLRAAHGYPDYRFFGIDALRSGNYNVESAVLWEPLEKIFSMPLVTVSDYNGGGLSDLNSNTYVFLGCFNNGDIYPRSECLQTFAAQNPTYTVEKTVYDSPQVTVYLTRRVE